LPIAWLAVDEIVRATSAQLFIQADVLTHAA
jgi:hypothetical protein